MNLLSKRTIPKRPSAKRVGKPWVPAGWWTTHAASRHLHWVAGITSKITRRSPGPGLHLEAMTLTHPFRRQLLRLQTLIRHTHSEIRLLTPGTQECRTRGSARDNLWFDVSRRSAISPQPIIERSRSLALFVHEILHRSAPAASSTVALRRRRTLTSFAEIAAPGLSRRIQSRAAPAFSLMSGSTRLRLPRMSTSPEEADLFAAPFVERLLRRHRRIESQPFLRIRESPSQILASPTPENPTVAHRMQARRPSPQHFDGPTEPAPRQHSIVPAPHINMTQITDAVLQQLDRRLIAARERMGRI